jgi:hypothetical protein
MKSAAAKAQFGHCNVKIARRKSAKGLDIFVQRLHARYGNFSMERRRC